MLLSFANRISTGSIYQQCVERTHHRALGAASAASGFGTDRIRKSGSETARTATRKLSLSINQQGKSFIVYMSINPPAELKVFLFIARPQVVGFVVCTCPFQIQIPTFVDYATRRSHAVFVKWSSLRSIALLEHPVNHVRGGDSLSLPARRSHLHPPQLRLHFALSRCPSLHRCCHPPPPRRRHHSIRPYAYAKSSLPSLPPSALPATLAAALHIADADGYMRTNAYSPPRPSVSQTASARRAQSLLRPAEPSQPHAARHSVHVAAFVLAACDLLALPVRPPSRLPSSFTSPSHFPNKDCWRPALSLCRRSVTWPLPYIFNLNATDATPPRPLCAPLGCRRSNRCAPRRRVIRLWVGRRRRRE